VTLATRDNASEVLANISRSERSENMLMVDEEAGDEATAIEGMRLMPACWCLQCVGKEAARCEGLGRGKTSYYKLEGILLRSELELRASKFFYASLDGLLVAWKVVLLLTQLARGIFGGALQGGGGLKRLLVPDKQHQHETRVKERHTVTHLSESLSHFK
jgi:hypothetical protein